jgi:hypothetical protein
MKGDPHGKALAGALIAISMQWMMIAVIDDFLAVFQTITLLIIQAAMVSNYYNYVYEPPEEKETRKRVGVKPGGLDSRGQGEPRYPRKWRTAGGSA